MSDNEIRQILVEKKRKERQMQRREDLLEIIGSTFAWAGLFWICFMLSVVGG